MVEGEEAVRQQLHGSISLHWVKLSPSMTVSSYLPKHSFTDSRRKQQDRVLIVFGCSFEVARGPPVGFAHYRLEISGLEELAEECCKF